MLFVRYFILSHVLFISLLATPFFSCASFPQSGLEVLRVGMTLFAAYTIIILAGFPNANFFQKCNPQMNADK